MNIAGVIPVDDPSYRYQMPRLQAKVEGRGNGIKTLIVNVTDIGLALNRDAPEICKFFGTELGSQLPAAAASRLQQQKFDSALLAVNWAAATKSTLRAAPSSTLRTGLSAPS
jgi:hypothetical protein